MATALTAPPRRKRPKTRIAVAAFGVVVGGAVIALAIGAWRWNRATAHAVARLDPGRARTEAFSVEQLEGLPTPVARYFRFALTPGQPLIRQARIAHAGDFALRRGEWGPFTSVQHVSAHPPGFVWDASIRVGGLPVRVRDSYRRGEGSMRAAIAALVPMVDQHGTPELAAGALARYLAEAPWFPTALLPSDILTWTAVDDDTARATLTDGEVSVSLDFHFGPSDEIVRVSGDRYRDVDGRGVLTPFEGLHRRYERHGGMMIPTEGEVAWLLSEGRHAYWRGRVVDAAYAL